MSEDLSLESIEKKLTSEIARISGKNEQDLDPDQSLYSNGVNSMGFMELLLSVEKNWGIHLLKAGIHASDVKSIRALAESIRNHLAN